MNQNKLPSLYVLLIKRTNNIDRTIYKKLKNTDIYLNWNLNVPTTWKRVALRKIFSHAFKSAQVKRLSMKK